MKILDNWKDKVHIEDYSAAFLFFKVEANQSKPSKRPSPLRAQVPCMCHFLFLRSNRPNPSHTSVIVIAPFYKRIRKYSQS